VTLPGGIPRDPSFRAITRDMARVRTSYASDGQPACAGGHTVADWPVDGLDIGLFAGIGALPATRTEYPRLRDRVLTRQPGRGRR
jgi:hypothetical protein